MNATWKGALLGAVGVLVLMVVVAAVIVLTGGYNVAATKPHTPIVALVLGTTFDNSVKAHAKDIGPPPQFSPAMISAGAGEYKATCAHCHGGVGQERAEWAEGMLLKPPALARAAAEWSPAEVFWLVKHGAKMTGMPAFGPSHDDATIWNIAAFVKAMPKMSAAQYAGYQAEHEGDKGHEHSASSEHHGE